MAVVWVLVIVDKGQDVAVRRKAVACIKRRRAEQQQEPAGLAATMPDRGLQQAAGDALAAMVGVGADLGQTGGVNHVAAKADGAQQNARYGR